MAVESDTQTDTQTDKALQRRLKHLKRQAAGVSFRLRFGEALQWFVFTLPVPLLTAIVCVAVIKYQHIGREGTLLYAVAVGIAALVPIASALFQMFRRRPALRGAIMLDKHYGLHDRITNTLSFATLPPNQRTPMMRLAIRDGCASADKLSLRKAAPLAWPREGWLALALCVLLAGLSVLELRTTKVVVQAKTLEGITLAEDDLDFFRDALRQARDDSSDPLLRASIDKFNQLIDDLANKRLDRTEAFRQMEALERELRAGLETDKQSIQESLERMAKELRNSEITKQVAEALTRPQLDEAQKHLRQAAQKLRENQSKNRREQLRKALEKSSQANKQRLDELRHQRDELRKQHERLLKQREKNKANKDQQRLLDKNKRELDRLERQLQQQENTNRQLSRLDRELAQAAANLAKELGASADNFERAAQELAELSRNQMTDEQKERLKQQIQQMRELLRQQGQGGHNRAVRMMRFSQRAKGQQQRGKQGQRGQQGQPGQQPTGKDGEEVWVIGPDGKPMLIVQQSNSSSGSSAFSLPSSSKQWGTGHDERLTGKATQGLSPSHDVTAQATDTGTGPTRAQVILDAAERGFVGTGYSKVFREYETVAEEAIDKEQVPAGYRFYVQRYFQLIRPRE